MEDPRPVFIFFLLFFIWFAPNRSAVPIRNGREETRLENEKSQDFNVLANSTYGDLLNPDVGLNLTGFRVDDGYHWEALPQVFEQSRVYFEQSLTHDGQQTAVYQSFDGEVRGDFARVAVNDWNAERKYNLTVLDSGATYFSEHAQYNVTSAQGLIALDLEDTDESFKRGVKGLKATMGLAQYDSYNTSFETRRLQGLHFSSGLTILTTASRKFNSLPAQAHLLPGHVSELFINATTYLNDSLTQAWAEPQAPSGTLFAAPSCDLVVWLVPKPMRESQQYIDEVESELQDPVGAPILSSPLLALSAIVFSPDCGYLLQAPTLTGVKIEVFSSLTMNFLAGLFFVLMAQTVLLRRQMMRSSTPSAKARVNYYTILIGVFGDALMLLAMIGLAVVDSSLYSLAAGCAFLCIMAAVLGLKFALGITEVQMARPVNGTRAQQTEPESGRPMVTDIRLSEAGLPLPATAQTETSSTIPTTAIMQQTTANQQADTPSLYVRFCLIMVVLFFLNIWAVSWSPTVKSAWIFSLTTTYFATWWPQIYHNIMRNSYPLKSLSAEFIIGSTIIRAIPCLYLVLKPRNLFHTQVRPRLAVWLIGWVLVQLVILSVQELVGPRLRFSDYLESKGWVPLIYDYHKILYDDLESASLLEGAYGRRGSTASMPDKERGHDRVFDCAICMNEVVVPIQSRDEAKQAGRQWLLDKSYMITPCRHVFHTDCLEGWMNLRLVCPTCRETLPVV